ncbi:MAG: baseplate hub domain-containing protein [Xanthobacteraceae bacterium]
MKAWYASGATTATTCWKATLQNGTVVAATKLDRDLVIDGVTYQSVIGYLDSDVASSSELNPDNLEVEGFLQSPAITAADIHSGAWDYAAIEMFEVNYNDLTMGKNILRSGTLGEVKGGRIKFTAELRGLMQAYTNTVVRLMTKDCNADFGDARCKVNIASYTATGTVQAANSTNSVIYDSSRIEPGADGAKAITGISQASPAVVQCPGHGFTQNATVQLSDIVGCVLAGATKDGMFYAGSGDGLNGLLFQITLVDADHFSIPVDTRAYNSNEAQGVTDPLQVYSPYVSGGLAHPANASGYFDHGKITFTSGENAGLSMEVKAYAPGVISLMLPMPYEIAVGDAYTMISGCNQAFETCKNRYNNVINFRGFPNLPQSKIYRRGAEGVTSTDGTGSTTGGTGTSSGSGSTGGTGGAGGTGTGGTGSGGSTGGGSSAGSRNALLQPFASTSIWNMPIGSGATYVPAGIDPNPENNAFAYMPGVDGEHIILTPTAPLTDIRYSNVGWSGGDRCVTGGALMVQAPIPSDYLVPNSNRNEGAAILLADGRTIVQVQPIARCSSGSYATALVKEANVDLYGDGITGAHGGSGLSSIGGSIRLGELRPGQQGPQHALKVNVYAKQALFKATTHAEGFRWPAITCDSYAVGWYGTATNNTNTAMKQGALLAIPASVDITTLGLVTEPAKQLAWTLQNYGAYIVDDTYAPGFDFSVEVGPAGSKATEFQSDYGFAMAQKVGTQTDWVQDVQKLVAALYVVNNNTASSAGGGGTPRQPLAPAI